MEFMELFIAFFGIQYGNCLGSNNYAEIFETCSNSFEEEKIHSSICVLVKPAVQPLKSKDCMC